jgi:uncharacterized membrane protein (UPF0127 family)
MATEGWVMSDGIVVASALLDEEGPVGLTMVRRCLSGHVAVVARPRMLLVALAATAPVEVALLDKTDSVTHVRTLRPWQAVMVHRAASVVVAPIGVLERGSVTVGRTLEFKGAL